MDDTEWAELKTLAMNMLYENVFHPSPPDWPTCTTCGRKLTLVEDHWRCSMLSHNLVRRPDVSDPPAPSPSED